MNQQIHKTRRKCPFVQDVQVKGGIIISNNEKCDIINIVQATGMSSL